MIYKRRYLQYNEFVIDSYDMLAESPHNAEFKSESQEYGFGHGSYAPLKRNYMFVREQEVSLSITLDMRKLPCEFRQFYQQFAVRELTKPGKLWAIVNGGIVWAYAQPTAYSENDDVKPDRYRIELDLLLPEGIWHKADKLKTFLIPYDVCTFMDCLGYKENNPCEYMYDCCDGCIDKNMKPDDEDCCCCCEELVKEMALCFHKDLQMLYNECMPSYRFVYDCRKANEFFGDKFLGEKICTKDSCDGIIAGRFYSETEIPTTSYEIVIDGAVHNPQISINGNKNIIKGDYDRLFISSNGDVYSETKNACCKKLLDPSVWVVPTTDDEYGWTIHQGENRLVIDRGSCCGRACAYIQMDNLTI